MNSTPTTFSDLAPTDKLAHIAWQDGLLWAIDDPETLQAFREQTGNNWQPGRTPLDKMIDEATGTDREFMLAFARWFNKAIWGEVDGRASNGDEGEE